MDGYEASKKIRNLILQAKQGIVIEKQLKIVAITGHIEPEYLQKASSHGINQVFPKPMPILELGAILLDLKFIKEIPKALLNKHKEWTL